MKTIEFHKDYKEFCQAQKELIQAIQEENKDWDNVKVQLLPAIELITEFYNKYSDEEVNNYKSEIKKHFCVEYCDEEIMVCRSSLNITISEADLFGMLLKAHFFGQKSAGCKHQSTSEAIRDCKVLKDNFRNNGK